MEFKKGEKVEVQLIDHAFRSQGKKSIWRSAKFIKYAGSMAWIEVATPIGKAKKSVILEKIRRPQCSE